MNIERNTKKGGVVLNCEDNSKLDSVKEILQQKMGEEYNIRVTDMKNPCIKIVAIAEEDYSESIVENIVQQNRVLLEDTSIINIKRKSKPHKGKINLVLEVDHKVFKQLMKTDKIKVGWRMCPIYEEMNIIRCYKCQEYNHFAKDCKGKVACPRCAGEHALELCNESVIKKCINCDIASKRYNLKLDLMHTAYDLNCPSYEKIMKQKIKKIKYE